MKIHPHMYCTYQDYPEADAHAIVVNFMGCEHACPGCHNPDLQDGYSSEYISKADPLLDALFDMTTRHNTNKVVLQGGDPFFPFNREYIPYLLLVTPYEYCIYTGYSIEEVDRWIGRHRGSRQLRYLKCGKYVQELAQPSGKTDMEFRLASTNQVLYDGFFNVLSTDGVYKFQ